MRQRFGETPRRLGVESRTTLYRQRLLDSSLEVYGGKFLQPKGRLAPARDGGTHVSYGKHSIQVSLPRLPSRICHRIEAAALIRPLRASSHVEATLRSMSSVVIRHLLLRLHDLGWERLGFDTQCHTPVLTSPSRI